MNMFMQHKNKHVHIVLKSKWLYNYQH